MRVARLHGLRDVRLHEEESPPAPVRCSSASRPSASAVRTSTGSRRAASAQPDHAPDRARPRDGRTDRGRPARGDRARDPLRALLALPRGAPQPLPDHPLLGPGRGRRLDARVDGLAGALPLPAARRPDRRRRRHARAARRRDPHRGPRARPARHERGRLRERADRPLLPAGREGGGGRPARGHRPREPASPSRRGARPRGGGVRGRGRPRGEGHPEGGRRPRPRRGDRGRRGPGGRGRGRRVGAPRRPRRAGRHPLGRADELQGLDRPAQGPDVRDGAADEAHLPARHRPRGGGPRGPALGRHPPLPPRGGGEGLRRRRPPRGAQGGRRARSPRSRYGSGRRPSSSRARRDRVGEGLSDRRCRAASRPRPEAGGEG